jgi:hypothetical protein
VDSDIVPQPIQLLLVIVNLKAREFQPVSSRDYDHPLVPLDNAFINQFE